MPIHLKINGFQGQGSNTAEQICVNHNVTPLDSIGFFYRGRVWRGGGSCCCSATTSQEKSENQEKGEDGNQENSFSLKLTPDRYMQ